jgi:hypothetical protein
MPQSNSSSRNDLDVYPNHNNNNHYHHYHQHPIQNGHRARSETRLHYDQQPDFQLNPHYEHHLVNGNRAPPLTNPLWNGPSPSMAGSQPNLLTQSFFDSKPFHRQLSPQVDKQIPSTPLQRSLYASYPDNKLQMMTQQQENQQRRSVQAQHPSNRKQAAKSQYLDTNEFILRASNGQPLRNAQYHNQHISRSREFRPHSMDANGALLDVYY